MLLRLQDARRTWARNSSAQKWAWSQHQVILIQRRIQDRWSQTTTKTNLLLQNDEKLCVLSLPGWHQPEDIWLKITDTLLSHGIICDSLTPDVQVSLPLPDMEAP